MKSFFVVIAISAASVFSCFSPSRADVTAKPSGGLHMNLTEALKEATEKSASKMPAEAKDAMDRAVQNLKQSKIEDSVIAVGKDVPNFELPSVSGTNVALQEVLKRGPVVIVFYRGGWCPYCNLNLHFLQKHLGDIQATGASLLAISPERPDKTLTTKAKNELQFEVLSDAGNKVAREFGLVFRLPPELQAIYKQFGIDLEATNGDNSYELPLSATFIIDRNGKVVERFVDADYKKRMDPEQIVDLLRKLPVASRE